MKNHRNQKPNHWKRLRSREGFTMVEVMVALVIFAIGLIGVFALQGVTLISLDRSRGGLAARSLALSRLETLQRLDINATNPGLELQPCPNPYNPAPGANVWCHQEDPASPPGIIPAHIFDGAGNPATTVSLNEQGFTDPGALGRYRRYWHVESATAVTGFPNSFFVRLRVEWQDLDAEIGTGNTRFITYETILVL